MPDNDRMPTDPTPEETTPSTTGSDPVPTNELFTPRDGETSTAGTNYGDDTALSVGRGPQDLPGGTFDQASGLGSDETAPTSIGNVGTDSALGSDPGAADGSTPPATIGGQTLMMENDDATTNSNVGAPADDTEAL